MHWSPWLPSFETGGTSLPEAPHFYVAVKELNASYHNVEAQKLETQ